MNDRFALVSFCNNPESTTSPVLCIKIPKTDKGAVEYAPVPLGYPGLINHATGITISDEMVLIAFNAEGGFYIAGLQKSDLTPIFYQNLPEAKDIHSILAWDNRLYVVSTGTDEVLAYDILQSKLDNYQVIWRASLEKSDTHHVNSIVECNGDLFVSAFGPKSGNLWASALNGYIHNITRDIRIKDDIYHPHSLSAQNNQLYYCESHNGSFRSLYNQILKLSGYSRGVGWISDEKVCITTSIGRKVSRSSGQIGNPADPGDPVGKCGLTIQNIKSGETLASIDFSWFGPEVYDVLVLSEEINLLKIATTAHKAERKALQSLLNDKALMLQNISEQQEQVQALTSQAQALTSQMQALSEKERVLDEILQSKSWKFMQFLQRLRLKIAPLGSVQDKAIRTIFTVISILSKSGFRGVLAKIKDRFFSRNPAIAAISESEIWRENPQVSIVIPVYNAVSMTKECIQSLYDVNSEINFELIVVDNASSDETPKWLKTEKKKHTNLEVITMKKNIGFGPAVNVGIQNSSGNYIVILNNDTIVTQAWLEKLLDASTDNPSIGIVSPVTNYVGEGPQIDQAAKDLPPDFTLVEEYAKEISSRDEVYYEPNRLVFFCVLIKRELVDLIGFLDEGYEKGNFEDDDYCLRTRMAGYKLAIARNAFVYHHGSVSFKKNRISHRQFMEQNRERFYKKAGRLSTTSHAFPGWPSSHDCTISVIVRTKDRPLLLQRALNSLANQTFKHFEIVLVNDGGEDISGLLHSFGPQFPVRYIHHNVPQGRTAAVNAGIRKSQGKWIAYLDDDDIVYPWHLEALLQTAKNSGAKFVYSDFNRALFFQAKMITPDILRDAPPWNFNRKELLVQNYIPIHTWLHARECIDKVGYWEESLDRLEDFEFLLRVSSIYNFIHLEKVTCEYRYYLDNANSISKGKQKYLTALQDIYHRHPANDDMTNYERQQVINTIRLQAQRIDELLKNAGNSTTEQLAVNREIIRMTVGM